MVYDCISISPVIINSLSVYAMLGNEVSFYARVCYNPGMYSLHSTVFQQRFPSSNGYSLLFWTEKNQTHTVHQHFQASENIKINELCIAGYKLYLMSQVKKQDLRERENWHTPAVQGTGQEMCDTSKNRLRRHLCFLDSECRVPTHSVVWLQCPSQKPAVLATHMWNQEWNSQMQYEAMAIY